MIYPSMHNLENHPNTNSKNSAAQTPQDFESIFHHFPTFFMKGLSRSCTIQSYPCQTTMMKFFVQLVNPLVPDAH